MLTFTDRAREMVRAFMNQGDEGDLEGVPAWARPHGRRIVRQARACGLDAAAAALDCPTPF